MLYTLSVIHSVDIEDMSVSSVDHDTTSGNPYTSHTHHTRVASPPGDEAKFPQLYSRGEGRGEVTSPLLYTATGRGDHVSTHSDDVMESDRVEKLEHLVEMLSLSCQLSALLSTYKFL